MHYPFLNLCDTCVALPIGKAFGDQDVGTFYYRIQGLVTSNAMLQFACNSILQARTKLLSRRNKAFANISATKFGYEGMVHVMPSIGREFFRITWKSMVHGCDSV